MIKSRLLFVLPILLGQSACEKVSVDESYSRGPERSCPVDSLCDLSNRLGIRFGSATGVGKLGVDGDMDNGGHDGVLLSQFNSMSSEYSMNWAQIETGTFLADTETDFARRHGMHFRGQALIWHESVATSTLDMDAPELLEAMEQHLGFMINRYAGVVHEWVVVNEALDTTGAAFRETKYLEELGEEYVLESFRIAKKHVERLPPEQQPSLIYNDWIAWHEAWAPKKSAALIELVRPLVAEGLIDAVGLQMHLWSGGYQLQEMRSLIEELTELGLEVHITELDVQTEFAIARGLATEATILEVQAKTYSEVLGLCLDEPGCTDISLWGVADHLSWTRSWEVEDRPLLYDASYHPKPAYFAVQAALRDALAVH